MKKFCIFPTEDDQYLQDKGNKYCWDAQKAKSQSLWESCRPTPAVKRMDDHSWNGQTRDAWPVAY